MLGGELRQFSHKGMIQELLVQLNEMLSWRLQVQTGLGTDKQRKRTVSNVEGSGYHFRIIMEADSSKPNTIRLIRSKVISYVVQC